MNHLVTRATSEHNHTSILAPVFFTCVFKGFSLGVCLALLAVYLCKYGGSRGDRWFLQCGVLYCVIAPLVIWIFYLQYFYQAGLISSPDIVRFGWQVTASMSLDAINIFCVQIYFTIRTGKFFESRRRVFTTTMGVMTFTQFSLMASDAILYSVTAKQIQSPRRPLFMAWESLFLFSEFVLTGALIWKLWYFRRDCSISVTNSVMYHLGMIAVYCNAAQCLLICITFALRESRLNLWFLPFVNAQAPLYTSFLLINLLYRQAMTSQLSRLSHCATPELEQGYRRQAFESEDRGSTTK